MLQSEPELRGRENSEFRQASGFSQDAPTDTAVGSPEAEEPIFDGGGEPVSGHSTDDYGDMEEDCSECTGDLDSVSSDAERELYKRRNAKNCPARRKEFSAMVPGPTMESAKMLQSEPELRGRENSEFRQASGFSQDAPTDTAVGSPEAEEPIFDGGGEPVSGHSTDDYGDMEEDCSECTGDLDSVSSDAERELYKRRKAKSGSEKRKVKEKITREKWAKIALTGEISTADGVQAARRAAHAVTGRPRRRCRKGTGDPQSRRQKVTGVTRSGRLSKTRALLEYVGFLSILAGTRKLGEAKVSGALRDELQQFKDREVLQFIKRENITPEMRNKSINAIGLVDEKSDGRIKARVVGNGKRQKNVSDAMMESPTANVTTIKTVLAMSVKEKRKTQVWDVKGAYLHALRNPETDDVYIWLDKPLADVYRTLDPSLTDEYTTTDGGLFAKVLKALYGLKESAHDWYLELKATLLALGFRVSEVDKCLFIKGHGKNRIEIVIHVDDLLVTSATFADAEELKVGLESKYGELKVQKGERMKYLGMWIVQTSYGCRLEQGEMVEELLREYVGLEVRSAITPATEKLFNCTSAGQSIDANAFLSRVMKLMYIARMTRPDILLAVSFLASRVQSPTSADEVKLRRIMNYLRQTIDQGVDLRHTSDKLSLRIFTDASYTSHEGGFGHTGNLIELTGVGMIHCRSKKQSMVTKSSTEAEAVAMSKAEDDLHMVQELLLELTGESVESIMYTDSEPLLKILKQEFLCRGRSKYIDQHFFSIRDRVKRGDYRVEHISGKLNVADVLSKPITGNRFRYFRAMMMNGVASVTSMCCNMKLQVSNACYSTATIDLPTGGN